MSGLSHALVPAQESMRWSFGRLLLLPVIQKGLFLDRKSQENLDTQIRASQYSWLSKGVVEPDVMRGLQPAGAT